MASARPFLAKVEPLLNRLLPELTSATRDAFTAVRERHPRHRFYWFGLYGEPFFGYVSPMGGSEELLRRKAEKARRKVHGRSGLEQYEEWLRWDNDHTLLGGGENRRFATFEGRNKRLIRAIQQTLNDASQASDKTQEPFLTVCTRVHEVCVSALRALDREGLFGTGGDRSGIVLRYTMGDLDEKTEFANAKRLNPPAVFRRFRRSIRRRALEPAEVKRDYARKLAEGERKAVAEREAGERTAAFHADDCNLIIADSFFRDVYDAAKDGVTVDGCRAALAKGKDPKTHEHRLLAKLPGILAEVDGDPQELAVELGLRLYLHGRGWTGHPRWNVGSANDRRARVVLRKYLRNAYADPW